MSKTPPRPNTREKATEEELKVALTLQVTGDDIEPDADALPDGSGTDARTHTTPHHSDDDERFDAG